MTDAGAGRELVLRARVESGKSEAGADECTLVLEGVGGCRTTVR